MRQDIHYTHWLGTRPVCVARGKLALGNYAAGTIAHLLEANVIKSEVLWVFGHRACAHRASKPLACSTAHGSGLLVMTGYVTQGGFGLK